MNNEDILCKKFNRLTVLDIRKRKINKRYVTELRCLCDCGNIKYIDKYSVLSGRSKSCGCLHKEIAKKVNTIHGERNTRLYRTWYHMKSRCTCITDPKYKNYGERGITVCDDWNDFLKFKEWAYNNGYDDSLTIERIDVNKGYSPDNCKWITISEQSNNKTCSHYFKYNNKIYSLKELSNVLNIPYKALHKILILNRKSNTLSLYNLEESNYLEYLNQ